MQRPVRPAVWRTMPRNWPDRWGHSTVGARNHRSMAWTRRRRLASPGRGGRRELWRTVDWQRGPCRRRRRRCCRRRDQKYGHTKDLPMLAPWIRRAPSRRSHGCRWPQHPPQHPNPARTFHRNLPFQYATGPREAFNLWSRTCLVPNYSRYREQLYPPRSRPHPPTQRILAPTWPQVRLRRYIVRDTFETCPT